MAVPGSPYQDGALLTTRPLSGPFARRVSMSYFSCQHDYCTENIVFARISARIFSLAGQSRSRCVVASSAIHDLTTPSLARAHAFRSVCPPGAVICGTTQHDAGASRTAKICPSQRQTRSVAYTKRGNQACRVVQGACVCPV